MTAIPGEEPRVAAGRIAGADIVITSYTLLRIDFAAFDEAEWGGLILDEAQFVKNHNAKSPPGARRCRRRSNSRSPVPRWRTT